jgi:hypothetical protein
LGSFRIEIEPRKKCLPKIAVSAEIDPDGILIISAKDGKNEEYLKIHTIRNNNVEKFATILPQEIYEEEFEMLYGLYCGIKQQLKKVMRILKNDFCKKNYRIYIIEMDFAEIDFEAIRKHIYLISPDQPIEEYKNVYKSVFESFDKFCLNKKIYDINIYI